MSASREHVIGMPQRYGHQLGASTKMLGPSSMWHVCICKGVYSVLQSTAFVPRAPSELPITTIASGNVSWNSPSE